MGRLKSVAVFHSAENCMGKGFEDPMPCCEDVSEQLKVDDLAKATFDFKSTTDFYLVAVISFVLLDNSYTTNENDKPKFSNYLAPPPDRDIPVEIQSFLI